MCGTAVITLLYEASGAMQAFQSGVTFYNVVVAAPYTYFGIIRVFTSPPSATVTVNEGVVRSVILLPSTRPTKVRPNLFI